MEALERSFNVIQIN